MAFPALLVSHGAPTAALDDDAYRRLLGAWARGRPKPRAIVVVSAHAEARGPVRVNASARPPLIYDFFGLPPALYALRYPAPGAPDLARDVAGAFDGAGLDPVIDAQRGWDHGVLGARNGRDRLESVYEGFRYGTLSLRSFALAGP